MLQLQLVQHVASSNVVYHKVSAVYKRTIFPVREFSGENRFYDEMNEKKIGAGMFCSDIHAGRKQSLIASS